MLTCTYASTQPAGYVLAREGHPDSDTPQMPAPCSGDNGVLSKLLMSCPSPKAAKPPPQHSSLLPPVPALASLLEPHVLQSRASPTGIPVSAS